MKKTLAILTLVVLLTVLIVPMAMAEEGKVVVSRACQHPGLTTRTVYKNGVYLNTSQHRCDEYKETFCPGCGVVTNYVVVEQNTNKSHYGKVNPSALNHVVGSNTHRASAYCSLCNGLYYFTFTCYGDGTNCAIPF